MLCLRGGAHPQPGHRAGQPQRLAGGDPDDTHRAVSPHGLAWAALGAAVAAESKVIIGSDDAGDDQEVNHHSDHSPQPQRYLGVGDVM